METDLLKNVISAESQYNVHKIERNLVFLKGQIDVLISKTSCGCSLKFFNPSDVLAAECTSSLVKLISDPATKPSLILKCIRLFTNLVSDSHIRECMHEKFELTPDLVGLVVSHRDSTSDTLTAEAMQLLQKVTYGRTISFQVFYMESLVRFLLSNVVFPATGLTQLAMGILVNLTRDNFSVQSFIKNNENMKEFSRCLVRLLSDQRLTVILFSLTLLLNLCLNEKPTSKFYDDSNAPRTFQMAFIILFDEESGDTRRYTVDLFKDILKVERLQRSLAGYEYLGTYIEQTCNLLNSSSAESVMTIFELLQSFCHVVGVRRVVCKAMLATFQIQDASQFSDLAQTPLSRIADPLLATIHWAGKSTDTSELALLGAYDLLIEIYEELVFSHSKIHYEKHVAAVLPTALHTLQIPLEGDVLSIRKRCSVVEKCVKLLLTFCHDANLLACISEQMDTKLLSKIQFQFDQKAIVSEMTPPNDDWSNLSEALAHQNACREKQCKTSTHTVSNSFPNKRLLVEDKENLASVSGKLSMSMKDPDCDMSSESIHSLVDKMSSNLQLKDRPQTEIIAVYKRSVRALQTRVQNLQDRLEAKALASTQADRMLSQYRAREEKDDAEDGELTNMRNVMERYSKEIKHLQMENQKLLQVAHMHQQLTGAHTELIERYECIQKAHQTTKQVLESLSELHEMLQKHYTNLQQQYDTAMEQLTNQVSQLEFACNQHKLKITNYESEIKEQHTEISNYRQIMALVNSFRSGKQDSGTASANTSNVE